MKLSRDHLLLSPSDLTVWVACPHATTLEMAVADMPYGDRQGGVRDPHGNIWWISQRTVKEPYTP